MKIKINYAYIILAILILATNHVYAGSFYNSRGLGEIKYFTHAHAIGMGGSLIAIPDQFQINVLNPAGLVFIPLTRLSGDFLHEAIWNKSKQEEGFAKYTNLNGISLAIPLKVEKLVASVSLIPSSQPYLHNPAVRNEFFHLPSAKRLLHRTFWSVHQK